MEARTDGRSQRLGLIRHPASQGGEGLAIEVEAARGPERTLDLRYLVRGDIDRLILPEVADWGRADGLWRTTCFEAFLGDGASEGYREFNFSPSMRWAAYGFDGYRAGMADLPEHAFVSMMMGRVEEGYEMAAAIATVFALEREPLRLGLSAVIEDRAGGLSYWALAHPADKPDFHHPDSFVLTLPPLEPA